MHGTQRVYGRETLGVQNLEISRVEHFGYLLWKVFFLNQKFPTGNLHVFEFFKQESQ